MTRGGRALAVMGVLAMLSSFPAAGASDPFAMRHPQLCGVEFQKGGYRFAAAEGTPGRVTIERLPSPGTGQTVIMRFDAPVDFVDFVARIDEPGTSPVLATLLAFDEAGRLVDSDFGRVRRTELANMQVVTDDEVIREVHFRFKGGTESARVEIHDLDFSRDPHFCPIRS